MASILDPPILSKVAKMKERVCWQHPALRNRRIDQTRLILEDGRSDDTEFSFLVIGDSGSGPHPDHHPQRRIAEQMLPHLQDCRFLLHTGDVVYQVGSSEQYPENFIQPYREWLVGGDRPGQIAFDEMLFRFPFLAVPGNHDYYNLPRFYSVLVQLSRPLRKLLKLNLKPNVGWRGSGVGDAYARAFIDYLKTLSDDELEAHLDRHYGPWDENTWGLRYQPGQFTRLPNRYYRFRYGGIDFFGLDSSTFNDPALSPQRSTSASYRQRLDAQREAILRQQQQVREEALHLQGSDPHAQERLDDLQAKVEQLEEQLLDIEKQAHPGPTTLVDTEQLLWLRDGLIASWRDPSVRGRVLFFHHPPYVTEATKWARGRPWPFAKTCAGCSTRWRRRCLKSAPDRPPVNLVLNGHAHCFEYLKTEATGYADSHMNCVVCGGSGLSLRRQRPRAPCSMSPWGRPRWANGV
jgi:3',5'-cyclic AMP phosphodiesterase CpdA